MENKNDSLSQCLLKLSSTLNNLLLSPQENVSQLNSIEDWLKTNYNRIQLMGKNKNHIVIRNLDNQEAREDALFIFNSKFQVFSYSGTQNFFSGSLKTKGNEPPNLLDIVEEADQPRFKAILVEAIEKRTGVQLNLRIKTDINMLNNCTFTLDISSSNVSGDRFTGTLNFSEMVAAQLLEYQALILDNLPGMDLYLFDKNYNYLFAAGKEKERFDLNNVQFIGRSLFEMLEKKAVQLIYPCITKALQGIENEEEIRYKGQFYYMKGTPVKDFTNETVGAILLAQNITNDKYLEEQLKKSREEALQADKLKSIFIANLSHEIRTPLNAIIGFTEQLEKSAVSPEQEKYIRLINKASDQLLYLVTEVVFLFKLGMGKVYIEKSPFSMLDFLSEISETIQKQTLEKGLVFYTYFDSNLPDGLIGDSFRLRQVLMNLLVNAIKYTDKGAVTLNCKVKKETKKRVELDFEVKDTGFGISRKNLKNIFNVFEQGDKLNAGYRGGAGLGLGICKNLVELLDGTLSASSKVKVGSTFTVSLPFKKAVSFNLEQQTKIRFDLDSGNKLLAGKKILLADDDVHNRLLAEIILKNWNTNFKLVEDGQQAIDLLNAEKFDIALIDIHMPQKNGLDVVKHIRSNNQGINYRTPIVFITANVFKSDLVKYTKAGFDDYLIKPFREVELYNKLCSILAINPPKNHTPVLDAPAKPNMIEKDVFCTQELLKAAKGNSRFFVKMVTNFIRNAENLIAVFTENQAPRNWDEIGRQAHKLIPSFKYFSLTNIARLLEDIENTTLWDIDYNLAAKIVDEAAIQMTEIIDQAQKSLENYTD